MKFPVVRLGDYERFLNILNKTNLYVRRGKHQTPEKNAESEKVLRDFFRRLRAESFNEGVVYGLEFGRNQINDELKLWEDIVRDAQEEEK